MSTSGITNYVTNRNAIIGRALRIIGAVSQGATPTSVQYTEGAEALNDIVKEWQVVHGMPLWKIRTCSPITMVSGQRNYNVGLDASNDIVQEAPLKILNAWIRSTSNTDQPMNLISKDFYDSLSTKLSTGTPNQLYYHVPGAISNTENMGTIWLYLTPDATAVSTYTLNFTGHYSFQNFNASTDVPDFPQYWYNAIKWGLADQLAYEYGLGATERAQISKKAGVHIQMALDGGTEEGSMFIQPKLHLVNYNA
jgi:hypothetical protein